MSDLVSGINTVCMHLTNFDVSLVAPLTLILMYLCTLFQKYNLFGANINLLKIIASITQNNYIMFERHTGIKTHIKNVQKS